MGFFDSKSESLQSSQSFASPLSLTSVNGGGTKIVIPTYALTKSKLSGSVKVGGSGTTPIPGGVSYAAAAGATLIAETSPVSDYSTHYTETNVLNSPGASTSVPTTTTSASGEGLNWKTMLLVGLIGLAWFLAGRH